MTKQITKRLAPLALSAMLPLIADILGYVDTVRIWAESDSLVAIHDHDWSDVNIQDPSRPDLPFAGENRWAYVEIWDKKDGKRLWRAPSPAFTYLWISPDEKYIVGMSDIKRGNPYQLVVFDLEGNVIIREHVAQIKAVFTPDELEAFWIKYPEAKPHLIRRMKVIDGKCYVDFMVMNLSKLITDEVWKALYEKSVANPEFPFVAESVSNSVNWYFSDPKPKIEKQGGKNYFEFTGLNYDMEISEFVAGERVQIEIPEDLVLLNKGSESKPLLPVDDYIGDQNASPQIMEERGKRYLEFKTLSRSPLSFYGDPFGGASHGKDKSRSIRFEIGK